MALDATVYGQIDEQAPGKLAAIFDPTVIQARQLESAKVDRANRLQQLLGGAQTADPVALSQKLAQGGFADEALKYQGLADAQQQRGDAQMQRKVQLLTGAHSRIGARMSQGDGDRAIQEEYGAIGLPADKIQSKVDWVNANIPAENRAAYFLDVANPERITKREEAQATRIEKGEQAAADRLARAEAEKLRIDDRKAGREETNEMRRAIAREGVAGRAANAKLMATATQGKPPAGYRWNEEGDLVAIKGGPGDKLPESQQKQVIGTQNVSTAIDEYRKQLEGWSKSDALSPDARAAMGTKYKNLMLQAKEAYNLGVLNGPDLDILQSVITDPTSMRGAVTSKKALDSQASELKRIMSGMSQVSSVIKPQNAAPANPGTRPPLSSFNKP